MTNHQHNETLGVWNGARIDPVCGMTVEPHSAAGSYEYKGETYYFCSRHCLEKFRKAPDTFQAKPQATMVRPVGIQRAKSQPDEHTQISNTAADQTWDVGRETGDTTYTCP